MYLSHLEEYIYSLYQSLSIDTPDQLSIETISNQLHLQIVYSNFSMYYNNIIFLRKSNIKKEWQEFGHELCHYLRHVGNQTIMHPLFVELQEYQADNFAYHFCVPTFMLHNMEECNVHNIVKLFNVEYTFAVRRIEIYKSNMSTALR